MYFFVFNGQQIENVLPDTVLYQSQRKNGHAEAREMFRYRQIRRQIIKWDWHYSRPGVQK
ncbi:MAG: hypothetical protein V2I97_01630 [Desulfococcaceae bacterium]|jgi:hypothetical protein|nr:hypothetical protein [Desulfococcaceae bacterium]